MIAQSLGEYSAQGTGASGRVQQLSQSLRDWISQASPATWLVVGAAIVALWFFNRRTTRF